MKRGKNGKTRKGRVKREEKGKTRRKGQNAEKRIFFTNGIIRTILTPTFNSSAHKM